MADIAVRCFIEFFFVKNKFIAFDFGDFGVVIECQSKKKEKPLSYLLW